MEKKRCILIGAGEYEKKNWSMMQIMLKTLDNDQTSQTIEPLYIAVDGGYKVFKERNMIPDVWIGDFDSYVKKDTDVTKELIQLPSEKDDTDMLAAINIGLKKGCNEFHILGGTGKRVDHTIANIQCLSFLCKMGARGFMYGENQIFTIIKNQSINIKKRENTYVSIFAQTDVACGVTLSGFRYPLKDALIKKDYPIGISNEIINRNGKICVENGELLLIF